MKTREIAKSSALLASVVTIFYAAGAGLAGGPQPPGCCATQYCYDENNNLISEATDCEPFYCKVGQKCQQSGGCKDGQAWADAECVDQK